jgi:TolA-binding protein
MRQEGDKYRPVVTVLKAKKGKPTKVLMSGMEYELLPEHEKMKRDYINASKRITDQHKQIKKLYGRIEELEERVGKKNDSKRKTGNNR